MKPRLIIVICFVIAGAIFGLLRFNHHPADIESLERSLSAHPEKQLLEVFQNGTTPTWPERTLAWIKYGHTHSLFVKAEYLMKMPDGSREQTTVIASDGNIVSIKTTPVVPKH